MVIQESGEEETETDRLEAEAYLHQEKLIKEQYGVEAAGKANYGWGVDYQDEYLVISTKVYAPPKILVTVAYGPGSFDDEWRDQLLI